MEKNVNNSKEAAEKGKKQLFVVAPDIQVLVKLEVCENNGSCVWSR